MYSGSAYIFRVVVGDKLACLLKANDDSLLPSNKDLRVLTSFPEAVCEE